MNRDWVDPILYTCSQHVARIDTECLVRLCLTYRPSSSPFNRSRSTVFWDDPQITAVFNARVAFQLPVTLDYLDPLCACNLTVPVFIHSLTTA